MAKTLGSRTLSISIDCHPAEVYEVVSNPENLPKWAKETPRGPMKVRFVKKMILEYWITM